MLHLTIQLSRICRPAPGFPKKFQRRIYIYFFNSRKRALCKQLPNASDEELSGRNIQRSAEIDPDKTEQLIRVLIHKPRIYPTSVVTLSRDYGISATISPVFPVFPGIYILTFEIGYGGEPPDVIVYRNP